jgi:L-alanine-DL-glutamate epimerase-like enolase superfamily enzyme
MEFPIRDITISAYEIPTDLPESDATLSWNATTLVLVELAAGDQHGVGYTYASAAAARLIDDLLIETLQGQNAMDVPACRQAMMRQVRNQGYAGLAAMAVSGVDSALWDLKAKLLQLPLVRLLGALRPSLPLYGSGGFLTYSDDQLRQQLRGWLDLGLPRVKIKVGDDFDRDMERLAVVREEVGDAVEVFVDANSRFDRTEALVFMEAAADFGVTWMEQPLPPEDLDGLRLLRDRAPVGMEIADGEYGHDLPYFQKMLQAGAVDILMPDATRCGGITGFIRAGALCEAHRIPMSSHCAPLLHLAPGCALPEVRHAEYFHDHARIEQMLFDGAPRPVHGELHPDLGRPGLGFDFKRTDAAKFQVYGRNP